MRNAFRLSTAFFCGISRVNPGKWGVYLVLVRI